MGHFLSHPDAILVTMLTTEHGAENRFDEATTDYLEQRLDAIERHISSARAAQVELLRELDARQVVALDGTHSLKEWITGRLDIKPATASDLAVLAKSEHEIITARLAAGEMGLDRAAATTRLANMGADAATIERSIGVNVSQVGQLIARQRRMTSLDESEAFKARRLWVQPNLESTLSHVRLALPGADADALLRALDERADQIIDPDDGFRPRAEQRRVDALVSMALDQIVPTPSHQVAPRRLKTTIFVDGAAAGVTSGEAGAVTRSGIKVGPNTLEEIFCSGESQTTVVQDGQLARIRTDGDRIPRRVRDYVFYRDGGSCTADGCMSYYRLEPHHIIPRSQQGSDDPENLTLLCWFHHHVVVHQRGYAIDPESPPGRRRFARPSRDRGPPA